MNGTERKIQKGTHIESQLIFDKGAKTMQWRKESILNKVNLDPTCTMWKKLTQNGQRSECKRVNDKTFRGRYTRIFLWPQVWQIFPKKDTQVLNLKEKNFDLNQNLKRV